MSINCGGGVSCRNKDTYLIFVAKTSLKLKIYYLKMINCLTSWIFIVKCSEVSNLLILFAFLLLYINPIKSTITFEWNQCSTEIESNSKPRRTQNGANLRLKTLFLWFWLTDVRTCGAYMFQQTTNLLYDSVCCAKFPFQE